MIQIFNKYAKKKKTVNQNILENLLKMFFKNILATTFFLVLRIKSCTMSFKIRSSCSVSEICARSVWREESHICKKKGEGSWSSQNPFFLIIITFFCRLTDLSHTLRNTAWNSHETYIIYIIIVIIITKQNSISWRIVNDDKSLVHTKQP